MSKPKYLRHDSSPTSVVVHVENLIKYIFTITNNEKQFPKAYRYTLVADLRKTCLKMEKATYNALAIRPRYREQYKKRTKYQQKVFKHIINVKALITIAAEVANIQNMEHLASLMESVVNAYNRWIKNDKRSYNKLPTKDEFEYDRKQKLLKKKQFDEEFEALERDIDGFVILRHKVA